MKRTKLSGLFTIVAVLSVGCMPKAAPTVEYFRAHPDERVAQIVRCSNDPGSLASSPACVNAQQAADLERHNSLRNLPSMGLQPDSSKGSTDEPKAKQAQ